MDTFTRKKLKKAQTGPLKPKTTRVTTEIPRPSFLLAKHKEHLSLDERISQLLRQMEFAAVELGELRQYLDLFRQHEVGMVEHPDIIF